MKPTTKSNVIVAAVLILFVVFIFNRCTHGNTSGSCGNTRFTEEC